MFSSRLPPHLEPNKMARAMRVAREASRPVLDLTATNPTTAGFVYPDGLLESLCSPAALVYEASPLGWHAARAAVAHDYERRGFTVVPDRIVLTSSTSEAYSLLFKLLCEPSGDEVLTPVPSYPLFEHLTRLDGVIPVPYRLEYHGRWTVDPESLEHAWTPFTRALLAVSPNNPTGSCLSPAEEETLARSCAAHGAALIVDEVFADYSLDPGGSALGDPHSTPGRPSGNAYCLTFRLGGLSKSAGLPQLKLGWLLVHGPDTEVSAALDRLEFICDTYLSVSTPVQVAAPRLLEEAADVRRQIGERVRRNYDRLKQMCADEPALELLHADAGWSGVLRVPSRTSEEELVLELLERDRVLVHPGFFYDFPHEAFLVLSLLPPAAIFDEGIERLLARVVDGGRPQSSRPGARE
jgi:hypothetical protein